MTKCSVKLRALVVVQSCRRGRNVGSVVAGVGGGAINVEVSACGKFRVVSAGEEGGVAIAIRRGIRV